MKNFKVKLVFIGLAGKYETLLVIRAKNKDSAEIKALKHVGNRDLDSITVL
jgi:hypothetical protein